MWTKFKTWLIKKLGGYTKAEYDKIAHIPVHPPVLREVRSNVHTLRDELTVFRETERRYRKALEKDMVVKLAEALEPYVRFQVQNIWAQDSVKLRAEVRVLDWSGYDG